MLCFLFAPFARAREPRLSLAATVEMVKQSSSALISNAGLRRRQQQEGQHVLLSKLIHEIGDGLADAICTTALDWDGYDDGHRHINTVTMCLLLVCNNYKEHSP